MADISIIKPKKSNFIPGPLGTAIAAATTAAKAAAIANNEVYGTFTTLEQSFSASERTSGSGPYNDSSCSSSEITLQRYNTYQSPGVDANHSKCLPNAYYPNNKGYCPQETQFGSGAKLVDATVTDAAGRKITCTYSNIKIDSLRNAALMAKFPNNGTDIKRTFCEGLTDAQKLLEVDDICKEFFNRGNSSATTSEGWDQRVIALCAAAPDAWTSVGGCIETARRSIQNNDANSSNASTMVNKYCRGGDGTDETANGPGNHRTDEKCACLNARDLGFKGQNSCLAEANKALPGCDKLYTKMKLLVDAGSAGYNAIQGFVTDPGCISQDCDLAKAAGGTAQIFPYKSAAADCINVQFDICDIDITQGIAQNSAVQAQCNFPADGGPATTGAPPAAAGAPGMAPEDEEADGELPITWKPFAKIFDSETKQYAFMSSCCVTCLLLVVLLIFMMKGPSGPSSSNLLAAKLASI
jgi:hypothetical protein